MAFLFNRGRTKGPKDLCISTKSLLQKLNSEEKPPPRLEEELSQNLSHMKQALQGTADQEPNPAQAHQLINYLTTEDVLYPLALSIPRLPFDARKDAQSIFSFIFRFRAPHSNDVFILHHIANDRPEIVTTLCHGYENRQSGMVCGSILREAIKHEVVTSIIMLDEPDRKFVNVDQNQPRSGNGVFWKFFEWVNKCAFEVSADAFSTFRDLLTKHKKFISHFLQVNYTLFVNNYNTQFIQSSNYVTQRQSIKLLSELLLERQNYPFMTRYISSGAHLKLFMKLLKDDRRMINYEGFHVFKVFVANPDKSAEVTHFLTLNRDRLLRFLPKFLEERTEDMQFVDEKAYCVRMIEKLPAGGAQQQSQLQTQSQSGQSGITSGPALRV